MSPALALLAFVSALALAIVLFWPETGLLHRLARVLGMTERVRLEDTLKHLFKCEYAGRHGSVESTAGAVGVTQSLALRLLGRLEEQGLARADCDGFSLTEAGREYALHLVRTHRLLERFLADRTGIPPADWHREAERREHRLSPEEREVLAGQLGNPAYDPHGDPIPSREGHLPPRTGVPLTALDPGEMASIVHLGDEPREIYLALSEAGLSPSMTVRALKSPAGEVRFQAAGRELSLRPLVARHITVEPLPRALEGKPTGIALADLADGEWGRVLGLHPALQGPQRRRLLDLGLVPGTRVKAEYRTAGGDPVAYRVRGALVAIRNDQARWIQVEPFEPGEAEDGLSSRSPLRSATSAPGGEDTRGDFRGSAEKR